MNTLTCASVNRNVDTPQVTAAKDKMALCDRLCQKKVHYVHDKEHMDHWGNGDVFSSTFQPSALTSNTAFYYISHASASSQGSPAFSSIETCVGQLVVGSTNLC